MVIKSMAGNSVDGEDGALDHGEDCFRNYFGQLDRKLDWVPRERFAQLNVIHDAMMRPSSLYVTSSNCKLVKRVRTLYRFRVDMSMADHTCHYERCYLPKKRFAVGGNVDDDDSLERVVGNTMKTNIRRMYDAATEVIGIRREECCPCIVLYMLFLRSHLLSALPPVSVNDMTGMMLTTIGGAGDDGENDLIKLDFKSLNYTLLYDDITRQRRVICFVDMANSLPQVVQWVSNIFQQNAKKMVVATTIQQQTSRVQQKRIGGRKSIVQRPQQQQHHQQQQQQRERKKQQGENATKKKIKCDKNSSRIEHLMTAMSLCNSEHWIGESRRLPLDLVFRSGFRSCSHDGKNLERIFVQLRSGDEAATLRIYCHDCNAFVQE